MIKIYTALSPANAAEYNQLVRVVKGIQKKHKNNMFI